MALIHETDEGTDREMKHIAENKTIINLHGYNIHHHTWEKWETLLIKRDAVSHC